MLKKVYKYTLPPNAKDDKPDADGVTEWMVDFSWERDVEPQVRHRCVGLTGGGLPVIFGNQAFKIQWKDDAHNLTKLYPRVKDEDDDIPAESGSFFNFFEEVEDPFQVSASVFVRSQNN